MVSDRNKRLNGATGLDLLSGGAITYNYLNLPQQVDVKDNSSNNKGSIVYVYDAAGNKLKKITTEHNVTVANNTTDVITTTTYIGGAVYESKAYSHSGLSTLQYTDNLQFLSQEEGRIRAVYDPNATNTLTGMVYDYYIKDHLGNVRMVLTDEYQSSVYQATMETANQATETALFGNKIGSTRQNPKPAGFDNNPNDPNNQAVSVVNATSADSRVGPGIILKVMSGDRVNISAQAWYLPGADLSLNTGLTSVINSILPQLTPGIAGQAHSVIGGQVTDANVTGALSSFLGSNQAQASNAPKAFLNYVLLDEEQFKMVQAASGAVPVPEISTGQTSQALQANGGNPVQITRNGYLYVFVSNESRGNVYFDNIRVEHIRGALTEETHYYPFGLTMAGISSKANKSPYSENRYKYNGKELQNKEFSDGSGLELYDFKARMQDPQTGRFNMIDPHADNYTGLTPYAYVLNNPINAIDPSGMDVHLEGAAAQQLFESVVWSERSNFSVDINRLDDLGHAAIEENGGENDENFIIDGILPVYESITATIYFHIKEAQEEELYPKVLTRDDPWLTDAKRNQVLRFWSRGRPAGFSVDEYPFASSMEGGFYNGRFASTTLVPVEEQAIQSIQVGGIMGSLKTGSRILVQPIAFDSHPNPYGAPYFIKDLLGNEEPKGKTIYKPGYVPSFNPAPILGIIAELLEAASFAL